jgi:UDP-glucose 4-epimerase
VSLDQIDLFVHGRVVDTSRLARSGFVPRSTADAFDDFVRAHELGAVPARPGRGAERPSSMRSGGYAVADARRLGSPGGRWTGAAAGG